MAPRTAPVVILQFLVVFRVKKRAEDRSTTDCSRHLELFEETPLIIAVLTYLGYAVLIIVGHVRDFMRKWNIEKVPTAAESVKEVIQPISVAFRLIFCYCNSNRNQ